MYENVSLDEGADESPFERAIKLYNLMVDQPDGPPISDLNESIGMVQTLLLIHLSNQASRQTSLLEEIAAHLKQED